MKNWLKLILIIPAIFVSTKCTKNEDSSDVPDVAVNLSIYVNLPSNFALQAIGGYQYYDGGSNGIVVFRSDVDQFMAYDRHSTYQVDNYCQVEVDSSSIYLSDPCSGSRFSLYDGSVVEGPAVYPLTQYKTSYSNDVLRVYN